MSVSILSMVERICVRQTLADLGCFCPAPPAGSFQLCKLGVELTLLRLTTATFDRPSATQIIDAARATIDLSHVLVEFLEQLLPPEFNMFWAPCESLFFSETELRGPTG